jgi:type IV secretory pathway TrbD component
MLIAKEVTVAAFMTGRDYIVVGLILVVGAVAVALVCIIIGVEVWVSVLFGLLFIVVGAVMTPRLRDPERREGPS